MAEASNNKHSCFLFTREDGSSIKFLIRTCKEKKRLRPLIEAGGGQLTGKETPSTIHLIPPTNIARSSNCVCSVYIDDCIKENKLLNIKDYSVSVGGQYISQTDLNKNILTMQSRSRNGRQNFYYSEDVNIIKFLLEEDRHTLVNGVKMWKLMESLKIVNHTWQSTKDHFLKIILPNIRNYGFPPEKVERFQKIGKPEKGPNSRKRAARSPLEYAGTGKDVEEDDGEDVLEDEDRDEFDQNLVDFPDSHKHAAKSPLEYAGTDVEEEDGGDVMEDEDDLLEEDVDEFDQTLVQIAMSPGKAVSGANRDAVGKIYPLEDADSEDGDECNLLSMDDSSIVQLADKDEKKRVKGLRGAKEHHTAADDGSQEWLPPGGQNKTTVSNSTTRVTAPENADMQEVQEAEEDVRRRNTKRVNLCKTKTQCNKVNNTFTVEIAVADSQNDRVVDHGEEPDHPKQRKRLIIDDSSSEPETDVESEEVFPLVYSGKRKGPRGKEVTLPGRKGDSSSETTSKRAASPQPCTSKQIPQEVSKKPKKSSGECSGKLHLRDFVMNDSLQGNAPEDAASSACPADVYSQSTDRQFIEESLTICDKLMTWLGLSPEVFIQAIYQFNGSVDCAVEWLLNGSGKIWHPNDDADLFTGTDATLKVLKEKYIDEFIAERKKYLTENDVFP